MGKSSVHIRIRTGSGDPAKNSINVRYKDTDFTAVCRHCGQPVTARIGKNTCPHCGKTFLFFLTDGQ